MSSDDREFEQQRDIGKLWGAVKELKVALVGIDGSNGLRGEMKDFITVMRDRMDGQDESLAELANKLDSSAKRNDEEMARIDKKVDDAVNWGHNLWERERHLPGGCIGKKALAEFELKLIDEMKAEKKKQLEERRHTDTLAIEMVKSRRAMLAAIIVSVVSTIGAIIVAVISAS